MHIVPREVVSQRVMKQFQSILMMPVADVGETSLILGSLVPRRMKLSSRVGWANGGLVRGEKLG